VRAPLARAVRVVACAGRWRGSVQRGVQSCRTNVHPASCCAACTHLCHLPRVYAANVRAAAANVTNLARREPRRAAYQKAVREKRLAQEVAAARRERDFYLGRVAAARKSDAIVSRKRQARPRTCTSLLALSCLAHTGRVASPRIRARRSSRACSLSRLRAPARITPVSARFCHSR
jgi:hypothetical protein